MSGQIERSTAWPVAASGSQPLDADLTADAALSTTGLVVRTGAGTRATRSVAVSGTGLAVSNGDGVSGDPTIAITPATVLGAVVASQANQETATSNAVAVTPGVQQFHPSAAKCWLYATVSAGAPSIAASYNVTSLTDTGTGELTVTIGTDFSSANWAAVMGLLTALGGTMIPVIRAASYAAGSIALLAATETESLVDPSAWTFVGYGDQ